MFNWKICVGVLILFFGGGAYHFWSIGNQKEFSVVQGRDEINGDFNTLISSYSTSASHLTKEVSSQNTASLHLTCDSNGGLSAYVQFSDISDDIKKIRSRWDSEQTENEVRVENNKLRFVEYFDDGEYHENYNIVNNIKRSTLIVLGVDAGDDSGEFFYRWELNDRDSVDSAFRKCYRETIASGSDCPECVLIRYGFGGEAVTTIAANSYDQNTAELILSHALYYDDQKSAEVILTHGIPEKTLNRLLISQIDDGDIKSVELLLKYISSVDGNSDEKYFSIPLHANFSSENENRYLIARLLLAAGADPDQTNSLYDEQLLIKAINDYDYKYAKLLLTAGAIPNVINDSKLSEAEFIARARESSNYKARLTAVSLYSEFPNIPLHRASFYSQGDVVTLLLSYDADPNFIDYFGQTPLMVAVDSIRDESDINIVEVLLQHDADPNFKYDGSSTVWEWFEKNVELERKKKKTIRGLFKKYT